MPSPRNKIKTAALKPNDLLKSAKKIIPKLDIPFQLIGTDK
jgi:hypothetical protein